MPAYALDCRLAGKSCYKVIALVFNLGRALIGQEEASEVIR